MNRLSFMLENLDKTVILTGSQIPIMEVRNDAIENLLGALQIAGHFVIPEVTLFFNQKLFRGNRASKLDAIHLDAFDSPNFPPLVTMGIHMQVHWERLWTPDPSKRLQVHTHLNPHVVALRLFPGISAETLSAFLHPSVQGVVVETFGAGNAPDQDVKLNAIFVEATQRGVVFVNCTQCVRGHVSDTYKTGKFLKHLGLIPGADMTPECALTKLTFVLGLAQELGQSSDWVRSQMQVALRGELSVKPHGLAGGLHVSKAAASGNLGTLVAMHAESIDVQWTALDFSGASPLHHAVQHGHLQALRIMLRSFHGPKDLLAVLDAHGFSPLGCACLKRFKTMALLLIHNGARFHPSESSLLWSSLCSVIEAGDVEWLNIYHHAGMDMNLQGLEKKSLLHIAVAYRQIPIVQYLVERKNTQLHLKDMYGFTPLDYLERMASFPSPLNDNENEASLSTFSKLKALLS
ncbi:hypothetical protein HMI55_003136 [Coelomomyces lativittatus]|nr:hypothetical protein HMI55_003136 [Coelomomyces lativittatus]